MIRRTDNLSNYIDLQIDKKGMEIVESYPEEILLRAVSYLYTRETSRVNRKARRTHPGKGPNGATCRMAGVNESGK
jgi:hypothetical protein